MEISEKVYEVVANVFEISKNEIDLQSSNETIEAWDSLGHLQLIMALESKFGIRFKTDELSKLTNLRLISEKINALTSSRN